MVYPYSGLLEGLKQISIGLTNVGTTVVNFRLTLQTASGDLEYDDWGNPTLSEVTPFIIEATMKEDRPTTEEENPGLNRDRIFLSGRLIQPLTYEYSLPQVCEAEYLFGELWRKGKFHPWTKLHEGLNEKTLTDLAFGQELWGYFELIEGD
jgi:hypothetical protein